MRRLLFVLVFAALLALLAYGVVEALPAFTRALIPPLPMPYGTSAVEVPAPGPGPPVLPSFYWGPS